MKLNIQNLSDRHRRICFVPNPTGTAELPEPLTNPTVGIDQGRVYLCLSPRPNITCVGATPTAIFQLYIGADNARTAFRLRATVNGQVGTLDINGDGPWLNYFAFNVSNQLYVQDVLFMVYPFRFASGAYAYYIRMACMGTGEKRVELAVENLDPNSNIKLPFLNGNDLGVDGEVPNPTMMVVDPSKAHACLIPAKPISCVGATHQSGCIDLGDGGFNVNVNDEIVSNNITAESLLALGTFHGVEVTECHEPSHRSLPAYTLILPNYVRQMIDLGPNQPNAPASGGIRLLNKIDDDTSGMFTRLSVAIDNDYWGDNFIIFPSNYQLPPTDEEPVLYTTGNIMASASANEFYQINYSLWKLKVGNRYGWELRFNIGPGYEVGRSHAVFIAIRGRGNNVDVDNIAFTPGTQYEASQEPTNLAYKLTIAGYGG